jgi:membrane protein YqaA with SNARE-associated domain
MSAVGGPLISAMGSLAGWQNEFLILAKMSAFVTRCCRYFVNASTRSSLATRMPSMPVTLNSLAHYALRVAASSLSNVLGGINGYFGGVKAGRIKVTTTVEGH